MSFNIYESGEISLTFGLKYLDTYTSGSSIHYSILIHDYRHLFDYLKLGEKFIEALDNEKEKYWYELDAMRIEAEFIKHYLAGKYTISKFEEYLLHSLDNNNLNVASMIFLRESMNVFFYFDRLEHMFYEEVNALADSQEEFYSKDRQGEAESNPYAPSATDQNHVSSNWYMRTVGPCC